MPERATEGAGLPLRMADVVKRLGVSTRAQMTGVVRTALTLASVLVLLTAPALAGDGDHAEEVTAFAHIMADVRTAVERCPDLSVDWSAVNAQKERLHIADVDYFAFRQKAHDLADGIEDGLADDRAVTPWCADVFARYGPQGSARAGLLRR